MTDQASQFRVVLRGYEPAQVDRRLDELGLALQEAARQRDDLYLRVQTLEGEKARLAEGAVQEPATFDHLGARVTQILALAEEEAADLRRLGVEEVAQKHAELAEQIGTVKGEADRYAAGRRRDADTQAARILEDARRLADERIDGADRDAAARVQEAEAIYEEQRARSAKVAADFETTLASRRKAAEAEFAQQLGEANARLEEASRLVDQARSDAAALQGEASREARRLLDDAELQAATIVNDAKALAARVRADSDRELAAATQRRDSINAQLGNVRQMLATLTGTAPIVLDPVGQEPVAHSELPELAELPELPELPGQSMPDHDHALLEAAD
jgi:cell division septum initiation protein DivIVA